MIAVGPRLQCDARNKVIRSLTHLLHLPPSSPHNKPDPDHRAHSYCRQRRKARKLLPQQQQASINRTSSIPTLPTTSAWGYTYVVTRSGQQKSCRAAQSIMLETGFTLATVALTVMLWNLGTAKSVTRQVSRASIYLSRLLLLLLAVDLRKEVAVYY